jgi:hypothetical protein
MMQILMDLKKAFNTIQLEMNSIDEIELKMELERFQELKNAADDLKEIIENLEESQNL